MKKIKLLPIIFLLTTLLAGCSTTHDTNAQATIHKPLEVFLVRHAEKTKDKTDPDLTPAGYERASELAKLLRSANLEFIHSSDYLRTKQTAAPTASVFEKEVLLYDPRDLPGMADKLKAMGGRHLVVGHSNTTPQLTELLGGDPVSEIYEKSEYDRLYIVTIAKNGSVNSMLMRFGTAYVPDVE